MKIDAIALAKKFQRKFREHQQNGRYSQIADVITCALQILPSEYNRQIFGYIPGIFRQVELHVGQLQSQDLFIGEPVVYRVHYSGEQTLYGMPYFYVFCYLKPNFRG